MAVTVTRKVKKSGTDKVFQFILYALSVVLLALVVYPLYFVVIASFSDPSAVASGQVWFLPKGFTLDGYEEILKHSEIWIGYKNTIIYTVAGTIFAMIVNIFAAYALSRKDLVGRKPLMMMFIFTMFFNGASCIIQV